MAYEGYMLKMNNIVIPLRYMQHDSCKIKVNTQDLDSYQDAKGELHRIVLDHTQIKIEWNFPFSTNVKLQELFGIFRSIWGEGPERKCENVTVYVPEWDRYYTGKFYMPDPEFQIYSIINEIITYRAVRMALIEY